MTGTTGARNSRRSAGRARGGSLRRCRRRDLRPRTTRRSGQRRARQLADAAAQCGPDLETEDLPEEASTATTAVVATAVAAAVTESVAVSVTTSIASSAAASAGASAGGGAAGCGGRRRRRGGSSGGSAIQLISQVQTFATLAQLNAPLSSDFRDLAVSFKWINMQFAPPWGAASSERRRRRRRSRRLLSEADDGTIDDDADTMAPLLPMMPTSQLSTWTPGISSSAISSPAPSCSPAWPLHEALLQGLDLLCRARYGHAFHPHPSLEYPVLELTLAMLYFTGIVQSSLTAALALARRP